MKILITTLFLSIWGVLVAQNENVTNYLKENSTKIDLANPDFKFDEGFYTNDLFFFGFIHGSEKPQIVDLELLKTLYKNGVFNYAPEVDASLAYFLNQYLKTGNEDFLDFACEFYQKGVPQDASVQFKNKWKELYTFKSHQKNNQQISIIGLDRECSTELTLTHIAFMAPKEPTGVSIVDSLHLFTTLEREELDIMSGGPVLKSGKSYDYFFSTEKTSFYKRFVTAYRKDSLHIIKHFGEHSEELKHLMNPPKGYGREGVIYQNFKKLGLPLIQKGEKIYANYGYFHIHQEKINGAKSIAKLIKDSCSIKQVSIVGMLTDSECLKERQYKSEPILIKNVKFKKAIYKGYKTSKTWDGDSLLERVNGIKTLKDVSKDSSCMLFKLNEEKSPFRNTMMFADFKRGGKNWKVEEGANTTDYFQYIILMKNSKPNIPLEE